MKLQAMKKIILTFAGLTIMLSACEFKNSNNQSIAIKKTDSKYQLKASFPERKTARVFGYIKRSLNEDKLFRNPESLKESDVNLGDTMRFHLRSAPGLVEITFKKMDNTLKGYHKLEKMCAELKRVL